MKHGSLDVEMSTSAKSCGTSCCMGRHTSAHEPTHAAPAMLACDVSPQPPSRTGSRAWRTARLRSARDAVVECTISKNASSISVSCSAAAAPATRGPMVRKK